MHRLAALALVGPLLTGCSGDADAEAAPTLLFSVETPRQTILDQFQEIVSWSGVEVDNTVVLGQNRCVLTVAVSDSANAAVIRQAFMPIAEASATTLCPALVRFRLVPNTRAQVELARQRIDSVLADESTGAVTLLTEDGDLIVEVKNVPAVARAQKALAADDQIPAGIVTAVRPRLWMREAENPQRPPLEAYAAILADHYRRVASPATTVGVLRSSLPRGFGERNLQGMPIQIVDDAGAVAYLVTFGAAGQLEDGVFTIDAVGNRTGATGTLGAVGVDCVGGECFLVDVAPPAP